MPKSWLEQGIGAVVESPGHVVMSDAQGNAMENHGSRFVNLDLGPAVIQEEFFASSVKSPLLSLGKLMRKGWTLEHRDSHLCLVYQEVQVPVSFRRNSLMIQAQVSVVHAVPQAIPPSTTPSLSLGSEEQHGEELSAKVQPVSEGRVFVKFGFDFEAISTHSEPRYDEHGNAWHFAPNGDPFCLSEGTTFVYPEDLMAPKLWKFRTTIVRVGDVWELIGFQQPLDASENLHELLPGVIYSSSMVTIMHRAKGMPDQVGLSFEKQEFPPVPMQVEVPSVDPSSALPGMAEPPAEVPEPQDAEDADRPAFESEHEVPMAPGVQVQVPMPESIEVEGVTLTSESTAAELKRACRALGVGATGSKTVLFRRLVKYMKRKEAEATLSLQEAARCAERIPVEEKVPKGPTPEEEARHNLTHIPFAKWCPICVSTRSRRDSHVQGSEAHRSRSEVPTIALDFFYADVDGGDLHFMQKEKKRGSEKGLVLACVCSGTGMLRAIPLPSKERSSLQYAAREVLSFISYLGYSEVSVRGDNEPSMTLLVDKVVQARTQVGLRTTKSPSQPYEHQTNGLAEQAIQSLRDIGTSLLWQVKERSGFELCTDSDLTSWAYIHASFLHNCFAVQAGTTAYERAFHVRYQGKLAQFGETVYFALAAPSVKKGRPKFIKGIFIGKSLQNDSYLCATALGVYVSSTIRRLPSAQQWDKVLLKEIKGKPWKYGLGQLGTQLVPGLKERKPVPIESMPLPLPLTSTPPNLPPLSGEAGPNLPTTQESPRSEGSTDATPPSLSSSSQSREENGPGGDPGTNSGEPSGSREGSAPPQDEAQSEPQAGTGSEQMDLEPERGTKRALQAPPLYAGEPSKKVRAVRVGDEQYYVAEDSLDDWLHNVSLGEQFLEHDLPDFNPEHDLEPLWDWGSEEQGPPVLGEEEMEQVEQQSRETELRRLLQMSVLKPVDFEPPPHKTLKTRYVYDWRYRGEWKRRARLVCKQLRIWDPFRQDTFSPATCPSMIRLLPHMYASTPQWTLRSFDVKDAYLTVMQKEELFIYLDNVPYRVLKCLPGQQDAAAQWNEQISGDLKKCSLTPNQACPVVYAGKNCGVTLHVDDGLVGGWEDRVNGVVDTLSEKYDLTVSPPLKKVGDQLRFLKRTLEVVPQGLKVIIDPKYIEKMIGLLNLTHVRTRKVPSTHEITTADDSEPLSDADASVYRAVLGCMLYVAPDRPDCQHTISLLARGMATPTERQFRHLRYLAEYMYTTRDYFLILHWSYPGKSFLNERLVETRPSMEEGKPRLLEAVSDSDWAGVSDRHSISCGQLFLDGNLMFSYSRRQTTIALSSCESELMAATGAIAEGLFLKCIIESLCEFGVNMLIRLDSSSARMLLTKAGVSRIRHLDVRLLWTQGLMRSGCLQASPIHTRDNTSDIGTKPLPSQRTRFLMGKLGYYNHDGRLGSQEALQKSALKADVRLVKMAVTIALAALGHGAEIQEPLEAQPVLESHESWASCVCNVFWASLVMIISFVEETFEFVSEFEIFWSYRLRELGELKVSFVIMLAFFVTIFWTYCCRRSAPREVQHRDLRPGDAPREVPPHRDLVPEDVHQLHRQHQGQDAALRATTRTPWRVENDFLKSVFL